MINISELIQLSEAAGAAVSKKKTTVDFSECPEEYKNLSMNESSLYFENQMLRCELEYRDMMDESVNEMIQDMINHKNGIVNEASINVVDKVKQISERVLEAVKRIVKWIAKAFTTICTRVKALFSKRKDIKEKASKAIDDANAKFNDKKNSLKNESVEINEDVKAISTIDTDEITNKHEYIASVYVNDNSVEVNLYRPFINYLAPDELMIVIKSKIYQLIDDFADLDKLCKYDTTNDAIEDFYGTLNRSLCKSFNVDLNDVSGHDHKTLSKNLVRYIEKGKLQDSKYDTTKRIHFYYGKTKFDTIIYELNDFYGDGWSSNSDTSFALFNKDYEKWHEEFSGMCTKCLDKAEKRLKEILTSNDADNLKAIAAQRYSLIPEMCSACSSAAYAVFAGEIKYFQNITSLLPILSTIYCKTLYANL